MRTPRRQHQHVGVIAGGGVGRGEASPPPPLRAIRVREHQTDDWGRDPYHPGGRSRSPRPREHLHQLSPQLGKRRRREHDLTPPYHFGTTTHQHTEHHLDDGDGGSRGGRGNLTCDYPLQELLSDRFLDVRRPVRMKEFHHSDVDGGIMLSGQVGEEMRIVRPPRYPEEEHIGRREIMDEHVGRREIMVPRLPRFLEDGRGGKEIIVSKMPRYLDEQGGNEIIVPRPLRSLEDCQSGHEIGVTKMGYLEEGPPQAFLSQSIDHRPGNYTLGSFSGAKNSPRSDNHGEGGQDFWFRCQQGEGSDRDSEKMYIRGSSYAGLPPFQMRAASGLPSGLSADGNMANLFQDSHRLTAKDMYNISNSGNLSVEPFIHEEHAQIQNLHMLRRQAVGPSARDEGQNEGYAELTRRENNSRMLPVSEGTHIRVPWDSRDEYGETTNMSRAIPPVGRVDELEAPSRTMKNAYMVDHHSSFENDRLFAHHHVTGASEEYSLEREPVECRSRLAKQYDLSQNETEYGYEQDGVLLENHMGKSRSSLMNNRFEDIHRRNGNPPRRIINIRDYDMPDDRVFRRRYITDDEADEIEDKNFYLMKHRGNAREIVKNENQWTSDDRPSQSSYKRYGGGGGRPQFRILSQRTSYPNNQHLHRTSLRSQEVQPAVSLKRRLRQEPVRFIDNFQFKRKHDSFKSYHRYWKKGQDGWSDHNNTHEGEFHEDDKHARRDPPEDSEEFKQQVQKAFLRFSKLLNEDPHQQKNYREQGKYGSLLCCVCGSLSKEFVDTHSLAMHSFNTLKVGLRTDHLGLHKALCVLMGWDWQVAPDGAKNYHAVPPSEANTLKEDLILWPPLVIILNSLVGNNRNSAGGQRTFKKEELEIILKGIGVGVGKARVGLGRSSNNSTMLVKFLPTFTGLQEAEKLHGYYLEKGRGRKEFKALDLGGSSDGGAEAGTVDNAEKLYGFLATVEDLDKLDSDTKKRCVIKSRKEIEAIADAPLTSEEAP